MKHYCNPECAQLSITEAQQDAHYKLTGQRPPHVCKRWHAVLRHERVGTGHDDKLIPAREHCGLSHAFDAPPKVEYQHFIFHDEAADIEYTIKVGPCPIKAMQLEQMINVELQKHGVNNSDGLTIRKAWTA